MATRKSAKSAATREDPAKAAKGGEGSKSGKGGKGGKDRKGGKPAGGGKGTNPPKMRSSEASGPQFVARPPTDRTAVGPDIEGMSIFIDLSGVDRADLLQAIDDFTAQLDGDNCIVVMYKRQRTPSEE